MGKGLTGKQAGQAYKNGWTVGDIDNNGVATLNGETFDPAQTTKAEARRQTKDNKREPDDKKPDSDNSKYTDWQIERGQKDANAELDSKVSQFQTYSSLTTSDENIKKLEDAITDLKNWKDRKKSNWGQNEKVWSSNEKGSRITH